MDCCPPTGILEHIVDGRIVDQHIDPPYFSMIRWRAVCNDAELVTSSPMPNGPYQPCRKACCRLLIQVRRDNRRPGLRQRFAMLCPQKPTGAGDDRYLIH